MVLGCQQHHLDNLHLAQTDNHTNSPTSSLNFYKLGALPDAQPCYRVINAKLHRVKFYA